MIDSLQFTPPFWELVMLPLIRDLMVYILMDSFKWTGSPMPWIMIG